MNSKMFLLICLLYYSIIGLQAQNVVFPAAAEGLAYLDVTKPPFNAPNDGIGDATAGIQMALDSSARYASGKTIYLPNGTYLVSNTLVWSLNDKRPGNPNFPSYCILQGQSKSGVIIKLKDNCPGFGSEDTLKPIIQTGYDVAQCFNNGVRNLTINAGDDNSGAVGLVYYANNIGTSSDIDIICGDEGRSMIGLDLRGNKIKFGTEFFKNPVTLNPDELNEENGPLFLKNIYISGFQTGLRSGACQNSQTIENLTIGGQLEHPIVHESGVLNIHNLVSANQMTAIENSGVLTIIGCSLGDGDMGGHAGINNSGVLYLRDFEAEYAKGVDSTGGTGRPLAATSIAEWSSHNEKSLNTSTPGMLKLTIKETPNQVWDSVSQWQRVYAPTGTDASAAIQAAIDSGKTTIYFVPGSYLVTKPVYIRGNVRTVYGFNAFIDTRESGGFFVESGTHDTVVFNGLFSTFFNPNFDLVQNSSRVVVLKNSGWSVRKNPGTGDLFLEDVAHNPFGRFEFYGGNVWARQLNAERRNGTKILNSNTNLWILGLKTEWAADGGATLVETKNSGKTEISGFFSYNITAPQNASQPMFKITDSKFSAIGLENAFTGTQYTTWINETINGVTKTLVRDSVPLFNCSAVGKTLPLYVSNTVGTTIAVTGITVSPKPYTMPAGRKFTFTGTVSPANASNKMVLWSVSDTSKATIDLISGEVTTKVVGTVKVYGTSQDGNFRDSSLLTIVENPFTYAYVASNTAINLTTAGTADWAHWPGYDRKVSGGKKISNFSVVGSGSPTAFSGVARLMNWTDGVPTPSGSNLSDGIAIGGINNGYQITVPADTSFQELTLYCGLFSGTAKLTASLSDGSSPDLIDTTFPDNGSTTNYNITIKFKTASRGQTLTVKWVLTSFGGNVTLQGASLVANPTIAASSIALSPKPATVREGLTININAAITPASATNQTVTWTSDNTSIATVSNVGVVTGVLAGTTKIRAVTQDGSFADSTTVTVTPNPFSFTVNTSTAAVNLTTIGTTDWAHWPGYDHKSTGGSKISNFTTFGPGGTPGSYSGDPRAMSWTDGTPTASSSNNTSGNFLTGQGNGYQITVPADTTLQTLILYAGVFSGQGRFTASLSDASSPDLVDESVNDVNSSSLRANYTINFRAASMGQTLTVKWSYNTNGGGNATLGGAALFPYSSGSGSRIAPLQPAIAITPKNTIKGVELFPNPVSNILNVRITEDQQLGKLQIELFDISGKLVYNETEASDSTQILHTINCTGFSKGTYILKIKGGNGVSTYKVVLQ